jgi:hypothetical protein
MQPLKPRPHITSALTCTLEAAVAPQCRRYTLQAVLHRVSNHHTQKMLHVLLDAPNFFHLAAEYCRHLYTFHTAMQPAQNEPSSTERIPKQLHCMSNKCPSIVWQLRPAQSLVPPPHHHHSKQHLRCSAVAFNCKPH